MEPLEVLFDADVGGPLPPALAALYGGGLAIAGRTLYANFVQSIDGVVAIRSVRSPGALISCHSESDRFVMGVLRAAADAVLVGAGTLRDAPGHRWVAPVIYPELAAAFAGWRSSQGLAPEPRLAVLTASGALPAAHVALNGALILTTEGGAAVVPGELADRNEVVVLAGGEAVGVAPALGELRARGFGRILTEAGPAVTAQLLGAGLLDEVFVTQSPVLVGGGGGEARSLAGDPLVPGGLKNPWELRSVRRHASHLFLRYRLPGPR
ncbi:MAG TPA: dihydrofolate reductase family protein [Actinomycetota bacterium]|nr:dihydrofolate reductase family protein [Actinomycetota bacterium]